MPSRASKRHIDVHVFREFRPAVKTAWVRHRAAVALAIADPSGNAGACIVVADDETLHDLNQRFRGFDEVTDVLSFGDRGETFDDTPALDPEPVFPDIHNEQPSLGEVVLAYPLAVRQADEHNVSVEDEVALLIIHGILHLLGHDHADPSEEQAMKALERSTLNALTLAHGNHR